MGWILFGLLVGVVAATIYVVSILWHNDMNEYKIKSGTKTKKEISKASVALFILVPMILFTLVASITVVGTGKIAVMTRFGKVTGQELKEGIHLKVPVDKANIYDVKIQKQEADAAAASKDLQDVNAKVVLNYRIEAGKVSPIHQSVGVDYHDKLIAPALQETFKASSAKFDATQLITDRAGIKAEVTRQLRERLEPFGIVIDEVSLVNFGFSSEFSKAIEDKQVAQQNAERAKFNLEAAKIDAEAQEVQAATLSPLFLQKQAIEKWDGKLPQYYGGGGAVFNIPLQ